MANCSLVGSISMADKERISQLWQTCTNGNIRCSFQSSVKILEYFHVLGTGAWSLNNVHVIIKIPELSTTTISPEPHCPADTCSVSKDELFLEKITDLKVSKLLHIKKQNHCARTNMSSLGLIIWNISMLNSMILRVQVLVGRLSKAHWLPDGLGVWRNSAEPSRVPQDEESTCISRAPWEEEKWPLVTKMIWSLLSIAALRVAKHEEGH